MKDEYDLKERTKLFALRIIRLFGSLPKSTVAQVLGIQLLRSGTSVGANYREAHRGLRKAEFVAATKLQPLRAECDELTAIFVAIIKRAREGGSPGQGIPPSSFLLQTSQPPCSTG